LRIDGVISRANAFERLLRLKSATGTAANVVMAEKRALGARALLEQLPHGDLWRNRHGIRE
jgi:hypothetical protein